MKRIISLLLFLLIIYLSNSIGRTNPVQYLSPIPGAKLVSCESLIIIKPYGSIKTSETDFLEVIGSRSGNHAGKIIYSIQGGCYVFKPYIPFSFGEKVTVRISKSLTSDDRDFTYTFETKERTAPAFSRNDYLSNIFLYQGNPTGKYSKPANTKDQYLRDFPNVSVDTNTTSSNGYIFISSLNWMNQNFNPYLMILDNKGTVYFHRQMVVSCTDFKLQPNGYLTYYDGLTLKYYQLDSAYNIIDSFYCGNGYSTDMHELKVYNKNNAYLMSYDPEIVNMSQVASGGDTAAVVIGLIIQEIDGNKNVIFEWRSWDHFQITDTREELTAHTIDYVHGNAIDLDNDGNLLISSRHLDEITKINRQTGNIMWRLGGKNNQFTFLNDTIGFAHQHDVRRIGNGNITLFDNGNYHNPPFSRAVEYSIDENSRTANLVWQYRNSPETYGAFMGSVQRLENGNTLIGWGGTNPTVTEVQSDGTKVLEFNYPNNVFSYRAYRFNWVEKSSTGSIPSAFELMQNYPNPFNNVTTIKFGITEAADVKLAVYDMLGREVSVLTEGRLNPGTYNYYWNGDGQSSGVYFYKLTAGGNSDTKKMILVK